MNQPTLVIAPLNPTSPVSRHSARTSEIRPGSRQRSHSAMTAVWIRSAAASVNAAGMRNPSCPSDRAAARKHTAEIPKPAPDAMPIDAGRPASARSAGPGARPARAAEIRTTPDRLTRIPAAPAGLTVSPRMTRPKTAVCAGSVLE